MRKQRFLLIGLAFLLATTAGSHVLVQDCHDPGVRPRLYHVPVLGS